MNARIWRNTSEVWSSLSSNGAGPHENKAVREMRKLNSMRWTWRANGKKCQTWFNLRNSSLRATKNTVTEMMNRMIVRSEDEMLLFESAWRKTKCGMLVVPWCVMHSMNILNVSLQLVLCIFFYHCSWSHEQQSKLVGHGLETLIKEYILDTTTDFDLLHVPLLKQWP